MRRALALAARAAGETNPNPLVGCVIVKGGRVVGEAWHHRAGEGHAEVLALEAAGARARGGTLYVNLEPCAHQGRTPPCAPRVVAAGICRVVAAVRDPNPAVNGRGFDVLRRGGVGIETGVLGQEALLLNERFLAAARMRRPFVLLKAATTLDGRIATARGESKWITSEAQRRAARQLRRLHDAVAVGVGTLLADDPLLLPQPGVTRPFFRVVFDSRLRTPLTSRLVRTAARSPVLLLSLDAPPRKRRALEARGVMVVPVRGRDGRVSIPSALIELRKRGVTSLMVEGGSELLGSFLSARDFDQVALFRAPVLLGGRDSVPAFGGRGPRRLADALRLRPFRPPSRGVLPLPLRSAGALFELWYSRFRS